MADAESPDPDDALERTLDALPRDPGVYMLLGEDRTPVYVGKAKDLRERVRSYFTGAGDGRRFYPFIRRATRDVEVFVCETETEALILENNLIKEHRPRYNIRLVDDKTYLMLKVTLNEEVPRLVLTRRVLDDGARYFGPFSSAKALRKTIDLVRRHFPVRNCSNAEYRQRTRPCLQHQIDRCDAPCVGKVDLDDYRRMIDDVVLFLEGEDDVLIPRLEEKMEAHAERMEYEQAARVRDQIEAFRQTMKKQRVTKVSGKRADRDVFGMARDEGTTAFQVLYVRKGKLRSARAHTFATQLEGTEVCASFVKQHYGDERFIPHEVLLPLPLDEADEMAAWLSGRRGRKVKVAHPKRGHRRELMEMAQRNARLVLRSSAERAAADAARVEGLQEALGLERRPRRIECFDISNFQGLLATGSQVTFVEARPDKSLYRKYRIKTVEQQDDFAMMTEVLERRLKRGVREDDLPDLIVVDGGKGQLGAALSVMEEYGVDRDVCALAKARRRSGESIPGLPSRETTERSRERVFLPGRSEPVVLEEGSPELTLLQKVRDEAHRFAVGYHRELRSKAAFKSGLEEIPGVGSVRRRALLDHFGSLKEIKKAGADELQEVAGIGPKQSKVIRAFFEDLAQRGE